MNQITPTYLMLNDMKPMMWPPHPKEEDKKMEIGDFTPVGH